MDQQNQDPIFGKAPVDGPCGHVRKAALFSSVGRIIDSMHLRPSRLLITIAHFVISSVLSFPLCNVRRLCHNVIFLRFSASRHCGHIAAICRRCLYDTRFFEECKNSGFSPRFFSFVCICIGGSLVVRKHKKFVVR